MTGEADPQIVVVEGLDGVGKTTVTRALAELTGGVDVTRQVLASMTRTPAGARSSDARYRYWLEVNRQAGEVAAEWVARGRVAVIDSYVFRTVATHWILGVRTEARSMTGVAARPDRAVLLTIAEATRLRRLAARDGELPESSWHAQLRRGRDDVLRVYRRFRLLELDTSRPAREVARLVLESELARDFAFEDVPLDGI